MNRPPVNTAELAWLSAAVQLAEALPAPAGPFLFLGGRVAAPAVRDRLLMLEVPEAENEDNIPGSRL